MGNCIVIRGGNGSGKSRYAEALIGTTTGKRYYIATMIPATEENHRRIQKHRDQRAELGFETLELPFQVGDAPVTEDSVVLLEDVSNLFANAKFEKKKDVQAVLRDIQTLCDRCRLLVAVTISGMDATGYTGETAAYIREMDALNKGLCGCAQAVVAMERGQPRYEKGDSHALSAIAAGGPVYL